MKYKQAKVTTPADDREHLEPDTKKSAPTKDDQDKVKDGSDDEEPKRKEKSKDGKKSEKAKCGLGLSDK